MTRSWVPQATLERTREIVDALAQGASDRAEIAATSGVALRQVSYGVASARILGLLEGDEPFVLTALGREVAACEAGSTAERELLCRAVTESPSLTALAPGIVSAEPPSRDQVIAWFRDVAGLSANTAAHRAGMLFGWRKRLLQAPDPRDVKERLLGGRWRRIEVANLTSLEQLSLDFGPFTVLYGPTASGKSNVVDALVLAHELATDAKGAVARRGGFATLMGHGRGPVTLEQRVAATREALEHSYRRHRIVLETTADDAWAIVEEQWDVLHQGVSLVHARRADVAAQFADATALLSHDESMLASPLGQRALGRHVVTRNVFRLSLDASQMLAPCAADDGRMRPDGSNVAAAILRLKGSRSYAGLLETLRNIVPGLDDLIVLRDADGRVSLAISQTLGPGLEARLPSSLWSRGTRQALVVLVAAQQLAAEEVMVVELDELALDSASLALVIEALQAASRRAMLVVSTTDEELAQAVAADVHVQCRFRGGRTHVAAPGLRIV